MSKGKHFFTIPPFSLYLHTTRSGITKTNYLYMKKYLIPILAVLCASLSLSAQEANREITAQLAESYAELQSTYTPSFKVDGTNAKVRTFGLVRTPPFLNPVSL